MKNLKQDGSYSPSGAGSYDYPDYGIELEHHRTWTSRVVSSFRRDPNAHEIPAGPDGRVFDVEGAAQATATSPLQRTLKGRHLQMCVYSDQRAAPIPNVTQDRHWRQHRHWTIRWLWSGARAWRAGFTTALFHSDWNYAVLYGPCAW